MSFPWFNHAAYNNILKLIIITFNCKFWFFFSKMLGTFLRAGKKFRIRTKFIEKYISWIFIFYITSTHWIWNIWGWTFTSSCLAQLVLVRYAFQIDSIIGWSRESKTKLLLKTKLRRTKKITKNRYLYLHNNKLENNSKIMSTSKSKHIDDDE